MSAPDDSLLASPCKGEVGRTERCEASAHADGRGSRFLRTKAITVRARRLRGNMMSAESCARGMTPSLTLPLSGGGNTKALVHCGAYCLPSLSRADISGAVSAGVAQR